MDVWGLERCAAAAWHPHWETPQPQQMNANDDDDNNNNNNNNNNIIIIIIKKLKSADTSGVRKREVLSPDTTHTTPHHTTPHHTTITGT
jgi:hypothetical protein